MITLQVPVGLKVQVEFPEGVERSKPGSLHLRPGLKKVTKAEWDHMKAKLPELAKRLRVAHEVEGGKVSAAAPKKPTPKNEKPAKVESKADEKPAEKSSKKADK